MYSVQITISFGSTRMDHQRGAIFLFFWSFRTIKVLRISPALTLQLFLRNPQRYGKVEILEF